MANYVDVDPGNEARDFRCNSRMYDSHDGTDFAIHDLAVIRHGRDKIVENDATQGNTDTVLFGTGITPLDLIFRQTGNDLEIARANSTDHLTIQNWYTGAAAQTEGIQAGNGEQLLSTQVEQLIQVMAGFSAQTGLTWEQAIAQRPEDVQAILAANWQ